MGSGSVALAFATLAVFASVTAPRAGTAASGDLCGPDGLCRVAQGTYRLLPPPDWGGQSPLPSVLYFHGYGRSSKTVVENDDLVDAVHNAGTALIVPDGRNATWAHVGSPSSARDDLAFVDAVMADADSRLPLDKDRRYAAGFSQGGSMVWDVACYRGGDFAAFLPIAGAFWEPLPKSCTVPANLRHVHGISDPVVPMEGRAIRQWRQGDVLKGVAVWRRTNGCDGEPARDETRDGLACRTWNGCDSGKTLQLCLHEGGHALRDDWLADGLDWAEEINRD